MIRGGSISDAGHAPIDTSKVERKHNDTNIKDQPTLRADVVVATPAAVPVTAPAPAAVEDTSAGPPWSAEEMQQLQDGTERHAKRGRASEALTGRAAAICASCGWARCGSAAHVPGQHGQAVGRDCRQGAHQEQAGGHVKGQGALETGRKTRIPGRQACARTSLTPQRALSRWRRHTMAACQKIAQMIKEKSAGKA